MLVPIKDPKRGWLLEHRPATRRAASTPGTSGRSRGAHGPRTYEQHPAEQFKPLPFKPMFAGVAGLLAAVVSFLNIGRRKAA